MKETHLFILWENARDKEQEILKDIKENFNILGMYNITWNKENFSNNLSRFYGTNLPKNSGKEQHCGNGDFLLVIVEVENPIYEQRDTSKGLQTVNTTIFDKKAYYRELTGGGHKVHATNSEKETNHDLTLLLGKNIEDYLKTVNRNKEVKTINLTQDLLGVNGFKTVNEMFYALNNCIDYAILRNYESLPEEIYVNEHNDIDIICDSYENAAYILNAEKVFPEEYRVHYKVKVEDKYAFFDLRYIGDSYYDYKMEKDLLSNRIFNEKGFYTISDNDYFYSLIYHAILHKPQFYDDYKNRLMQMNLTNKELAEEKDFVEILQDWMEKNNYVITKPIDDSVQFKINNVNKFDKKLFYKNSDDRTKKIKTEEEILDYINKYDEKDYPEILNKDRRIDIIMALSEIRKNIVSWYPFDKEATVLEIGADFGQITGELCKKTKKVVSLEKDDKKKNAILKRHGDKTSLNVISSLNEIEERFDYIVIIGMEKNNNKNMEELLNEIKPYLKDDCKILIAIDNKYSLNNICKIDNIQGTVKDRIINNKYSLKEILKEIGTAGFKNKKIYYPMTDYKLTNVIFTDNQQISDNNISRNIIYNTEDNIKFFEQNDIYKELLKEHNSLFKELANSYFIEIFNKEYEENNINFVSFSNIRKKEYRIKTIIKDKYVYKYPENDISKAHAQKIKENIDIMEKLNIKTIDTYDDEKIISKFTEGETLDKIILKTAKTDKQEALNLIIKFKQELFEKLELEKGEYSNNVFDKYEIDYDQAIVSNMEIAKHALWDLIFQNCFYINNEFYFFDQEWREENMPIDFIIYRAIRYFDRINEYFSDEELYEKLDLDESEIKLFEKLDNKIQEEIRSDIVWNIHTQGKNMHELHIQKLTDNHKINLLNIEINNKDSEINSKNSIIAQKDEEIQTLKNRIMFMEQSKSWKITEPLRKIKRLRK